MLDLDSRRWEMLKASPGGNGSLAVELLRQIRGGDHSGFAELYHQVCHQFSVGEVAYAVVPHLIDIADKAPMPQRLWPLCITGTVAASRLAHPQSSANVPDDLGGDYTNANACALHLVTDALRLSIWQPGQLLELIATLAALHGDSNLAIMLFMSGGTADLSCPECGENIEYGES